MTPSADPLTGRRILLVEDEYFLADDLRRLFEASGAEVIGPVARLQEALDLVTGTARIDGAVLDINLWDEMAYPVADALHDRNVPFVFATGYDKGVIPRRYEAVRRCEKPVEPIEVARALFG
ncbi:response regulator [Methylobacterium soli]|uniref:Response regulator n=1 Tax=Methylobacterium soli TaxID=553447 RepID=A0A6L3SNZ0_9HYPH|nr:response regulator [Methylobacterium soli]KAB1070268.1 response regulator [Methylobacterium soli]GJE45737.1 hypothetical protein AEGHOMDF_4937 [Methylobacterium soli]